MPKPNTNNLLEKCRVCLTKGEVMFPLFLISHKDKSIADLIYHLACIEITWSADLPENVCEKCKTTVIEFDTLILSLRRNTDYLQHILNRCKATSTSASQEDMLLRKEPASEDISVNTVKPKKHTTSVVECGEYHEPWTKNVIIEQNQYQDNDVYSSDEPDCDYEDSIGFPEDSKSNNLKKYKCKYCEDSYDDKASLKNHTEIHRTFVCDQCGKSFFRKDYLLDHKFTHTSEKRFSCKKCGKQFKYRSGLRVHETVHVNYRGFVCDVCAASFNTKTTLNTHILLKHKNEKKFECAECHLSFKLNSWLRKHFMRKHSGSRTKDFVCSFCGVSYLNKTTLTRHVEEKHSGPQRRYPCTACDKTYASTTKLNLHMKKIHFIEQ
ncbi:unnamed protein product [Acanthoscelides obtectus]|uniref:Uncharacterized protein n=1 Tax=Acanthoscelides obtectus TaxID=200917 RepID=A0A9P0M1Z5_ACAOB|nr:unnamed protein product [Acanthoscelides obtectus]CAK1686526.1 hypothetical protein AOBTE_LOCUS35989 [Acanthoscelides obtectus]